MQVTSHQLRVQRMCNQAKGHSHESMKNIGHYSSISLVSSCRCWSCFREMRHTLSRRKKPKTLFFYIPLYSFINPLMSISYWLVTSCYPVVIAQSWTRCLRARKGYLWEIVFVLLLRQFGLLKQVQENTPDLLNSFLPFHCCFCFHEELLAFPQLCRTKVCDALYRPAACCLIKPLCDRDEHKEKPAGSREKWHPSIDIVVVGPQRFQNTWSSSFRLSLQCSVQAHLFSNDTKGNNVPLDLHMLFFSWNETISLLIHPPLFCIEEQIELKHEI